MSRYKGGRLCKHMFLFRVGPREHFFCKVNRGKDKVSDSLRFFGLGETRIRSDVIPWRVP